MPVDKRGKGVLRLIARELPQQIQIIAGHLTNISPHTVQIRQEKRSIEDSALAKGLFVP